jgi:hypothetical protein
MKEFLKSILEDNEGGLSSSRVAMLTWGVGTFLVWSVISFVKMEVLSIPESVLVVVLTTLGMKIAQRVWGEKSNSDDNSTQPKK